MPNPIDITGCRFGRLIALTRSSIYKKHPTKWVCQCDCGKVIETLGASLRSGNTRSCGCLQRDITRNRGLKHGYCYTNEYRIWHGVISRCTNENLPVFKHYGGRGITVCERWLRGENGKSPFECFFADVGERPSKEHTLDRMDNNGSYGPGNCHWATWDQQAKNKRSNKIITIDGISKTYKEWSLHLGMAPNVVGRRVRSGWSPDRAATTPLDVIKSERRRNANRRVAEMDADSGT